jgi:hypothetical protein
VKDILMLRPNLVRTHAQHDSQSLGDKTLSKTLYAFDCQGFAIIRGLIPDPLVHRAVSIIDTNFPGKKTWKFPVLHLDRVFWQFMTTPLILRCAERLCGNEFRLDHAFAVTSDDGVPNLHGGANCSQRSCFAQWVGNSDIFVGQLSVGIVLTPQSSKTGGVSYIPGSHKAFDQRDGRAIKEQIMDGNFDHEFLVTPELNPGDVIVFTESLIHGDTGWVPTNYPRITVYYKFCPGFMSWRDPEQQEKYKQYAQTPQELRLLERPWTGQFSDENNQMSHKNVRRPKTIL